MPLADGAGLGDGSAPRSMPGPILMHGTKPRLEMGLFSSFRQGANPVGCPLRELRPVRCRPV